MTQLYAQPAAGWYADPSGQHEARYWDGTRWTDRVADRGVENRGPDLWPAGPVAGDPPVAEPAPDVPVAEMPVAEMPVADVPPAEPVAADVVVAAEPPGEDPAVAWSPDPGSIDPVDFASYDAPTDTAVPIAPVPPVIAPVAPAPPAPVMPDVAVAPPVEPPAPEVAPPVPEMAVPETAVPEMAGPEMADPEPAGPEMGWYPDPAGRHEVRYWDGARWTERVADNGIETTESPAADVLEVAADAIADAGAAANGSISLPSTWAPDWYPDPTGRHEVRYFDGTTWTEHVANNGLSALDPIADGAPVITDAMALAAAIVPPVSTAASPNATTAEAAEAAFAAALAPSKPVEEPAPAEPTVLPVAKDWAARPNALVGWIVVAGAGILGVGSFGPWAKATAPIVGDVTQSGMNGDGRFMLALAFLLVVAGIGLIVGRFGRVVAFGALSIGTLAAIVCAVDMARISNGNYGLLQGTVDATAVAGIGLWACLAGAIVCIAGGIVAVTHR